MGFLIDGQGEFSFEENRESFVIHPNDSEDGNYPLYATTPHPEFLYEDLDDLIAGLQFLRERRAAGHDGKATVELLMRGIPSELERVGEASFSDLMSVYVSVKAVMLNEALQRLIAQSVIKEHSFGGIAYYTL